jgi:Tol biopolymer transport system component
MVIQTLGLALLAFLLSRGAGGATDDADADWSQVTFDNVISVEELQSDEGQPELGEVVESAKDIEAATQSGFALEVTDISWPDQVAPPPEIEPLFVRAFTDVEPGHNDSNPIWSPTGDLIAFERSIEDKREIIISPEQNSELDAVFADILEDVSYNAGISWSPDENRLVFMSNGGSGNYDLYLLPILGQKRTIRLTDHAEKDSHPHWSPVADRLVFVSGRTGSADIYLMDLLSGNVTKLTNGHKTYLYPQWSPDGSKIVMINGSNENHDIFLIEDFYRPLQTLKALTRWEHDDLRPVWSPDGKKIAFYSNYNLENDPKIWSIVVIAADGSSPVDGEGLAARVVAVNVIPDIERGPAWMPDSKRLVYVKNDHKSYNPIYIVQIDDQKNQPVTTQTKMNHDLACSADGTLAFRAQVEQWDHIYIARLKE